MFRIATYWISGSLFIKLIKGGASFLVIERALFENESRCDMYIKIILAADNTTAGFVCAKCGITL